jgi:hypothetical protein
VCRYPPNVSTDGTGAIVPESDCDDVDNDCDGVVDDFFSTKGTECTRGLGVCTRMGFLVCNGTEDGLDCDAVDPPAGGPESCNGLDDDCDGALDEGAPDAWAAVAGGAFGSVIVYAYEASRPDADDVQGGGLTHRPCSAPDRLPWTNVTYAEASAACAAISARLCTEEEWEVACTITGNPCNGNAHDSDLALPGDQDEVYPTGAFPACHVEHDGHRIYDMLGNVSEWAAARGTGFHPLRGGTMNTPPEGLTCGNHFPGSDLPEFLFNNVGFRCCKDP